MAGPPEQYALPAAENERIFRDELLPETGIADLPSQERPRAVFLVGQPGAGKTRLAELLGRALDARGGYVTVDSDLYKPYHPAYAELMAESDHLMAAQTGPDGQAWMRKVQAYAREHQLDVLVHETVQNPQYFVEQLNIYHRAGYRVEIAVVAVAEPVSHQGVLHRYYQQVADRGHGRLSVPEKAAASYVGIVQAAEVVDELRLADDVAVYRRSEKAPRYRNTLTNEGEWAAPARFSDAIETERGRPLDHVEAEQFHLTQTHLRGVAEPKRQPELDEIEAAAEFLLPALLAVDPARTDPDIETQHRELQAAGAAPRVEAEALMPEPEPIVREQIESNNENIVGRVHRATEGFLQRRADQVAVAEEEAAHIRDHQFETHHQRSRELGNTQELNSREEDN